jgi:hypothetical protein
MLYWPGYLVLLECDVRGYEGVELYLHSPHTCSWPTQWQHFSLRNQCNVVKLTVTRSFFAFLFILPVRRRVPRNASCVLSSGAFVLRFFPWNETKFYVLIIIIIIIIVNVVINQP